MCFVAKSPQPTTRVFGLGDIGIPLEEFQKEILSLVAIPDEAMPATGLEEGDSFYFSSRGRIRGQTWTWLGHYRHAIDPGGRKGAYFATGVLLLNQICDGQAVADMIGALDDFFRRDVLEDRQRIPENWQSLRLLTPVKLLSTETDAHVGELRPGHGISAEASRLMYRRESLTFDQVAFFLDTIQSDASLQSSGRMVFGPSMHFAEKLSGRSDLDAFNNAPAGSRETPDRPVALRAGDNRDGLPANALVAAQPTRFSDSEPTINASVFDRAMGEIRRELGEMQQVAVDNTRAIRLHRRVAWLCVAIIVIAAGYGLVGAIDGTIANAELTQMRSGRIVDILSAEIGKLKADIARLRITPLKPLATHSPKPPVSVQGHGGDGDDNSQSDDTIGDPPGGHQSHGGDRNHRSAQASDLHGGRHTTAPNRPGGRAVETDNQDMIPDKTCQDPSKTPAPVKLPNCSRAVLKKHHRKI